MGKYGAVRTSGFASKLEKAVYEVLKKREDDGEISSLQCQSHVELQPGKRDTKIVWIADFAFIKNGEQWYAEAKGMATDVWKIKLRMVRYQKIKTEIWAGSYARPYLQEVIE